MGEKLVSMEKIVLELTWMNWINKILDVCLQILNPIALDILIALEKMIVNA